MSVSNQGFIHLYFISVIYIYIYIYMRMNLQEVGCGYMDWIGLAQNRNRWWTLVSAVMNLRVLWNAGNFLTSCKPASFSRRTLHHGVSKYIYIAVEISTLALAHPLSYWIGTGDHGHFVGAKWPQYETDFSFPSNAKFQNKWSYTPPPLYAFYSVI